MSGLTYETVSRVAQQAGTLYFTLIFIVALAWALWPRNKADFDDAAQIPFRERPPTEGLPAAETPLTSPNLSPDLNKGEL
jgi:cytochrome c oxidase cbb3-type subunit 4